MKLELDHLPAAVRETVAPLIVGEGGSLALEDVWRVVDEAWDHHGCDSQRIDPDRLEAFYNDPVWLLNGLYIEQDPVSLAHRRSIAKWIGCQPDVRSVLDFGGGLGTLARIMADELANKAQIDVFEPRPAPYAVELAAAFPSIRFVDSLEQEYDVLVSTDVLEHVVDPLGVLGKLIRRVRGSGYLVVANCFFPVVKCHLPDNFHLRYTFDRFAGLMGLECLGPCPGSHARIYKKIVQERPIPWGTVRALEGLSRVIFPVLSAAARARAALRPRG